MPTEAKAKAPATQEPTSPAKPETAIRFGSVSAAVFTDTRDVNGKSVTFYNVSLRRSYKTDDGDWKQTQTLRPEDLLPAALALTDAFRRIKKLQSE